MATNKTEKRMGGNMNDALGCALRNTYGRLYSTGSDYWTGRDDGFVAGLIATFFWCDLMTGAEFGDLSPRDCFRDALPAAGSDLNRGQ